MNITTYTEFKDIAVGTKFICGDGFTYTKMSDTIARHDDVRYNVGFMDYEMAADDRFRVQS